MSNDVASYNDFNEVLEKNKALAQLTMLYENEQREKEKVRSLYEELKVILDKTKKEASELNQKLVEAYTSRKEQASHFEAEISQLQEVFI